VRLLAALAVLVCLTVTRAVAANVGFEEIKIPNGDEPPLMNDTALRSLTSRRSRRETYR
jgi:hypothetical protein